MKTLAIIPARAGSKEFPGKNKALLGGKPLYRWVLDTAQASHAFESIVVSTDDLDIITYCLNHGVSWHERTQDLAGDDVNISLVLLDILNKAMDVDAFALLQPTSPFIRVQDIAKCLTELYAHTRVDSVQTIREVAHHDHAYNQRLVNKRGMVEFADPGIGLKLLESINALRAYYYNKQRKPMRFAFGNMVATKIRSFLRAGDIWGKSLGIEIPKPYAVDIDYPDDLEYAEWLLDSGKVVFP